MEIVSTGDNIYSEVSAHFYVEEYSLQYVTAYEYKARLQNIRVLW
jgi:hypothetical protein